MTNDPVARARDLEQRCRAFESSWRDGSQPDIEHFLGDLQDPHRTDLARELALLDMDYRTRRGEQPDPQDYARRFPGLDPSSLADSHAEHTPNSQDTTELPPLCPPGYAILGKLGHGGMGVVYKAAQLAAGGRTVALKVLLVGPHASPEKVWRFQAEAEAVALINHPHVLPVYDVGRHHGQPYFTMEFAPNGSLADRLRRNDPMIPPQAATLVERIARGVAAAHAQGIVHRDLKPGNVLITTDGNPKVSDFGLAKRLEDDGEGHTVTGAIFGTPAYLAPEQAAGRAKHSGTAADVWSLGVILYELLAGRVPFRGAEVGDTLKLIQDQDPVPPRRLQPSIPRDLETVCLKCLEKDPASRYPNGAALAEDLGRFLAGRPVQARRVGPLGRAWRWANRNPGVAASSVGMVLALVAATAVSTAVLVWASQAQETTRLRLETEARNREIEQSKQNEAYLRLSNRIKLLRMSGGPGRRFLNLVSIAQAAAIRPSRELRNEAIASLSQVDFRKRNQLPQTWSHEIRKNNRLMLALDGSLARFAREEVGGAVSIRRTRDGELIARLPGRGGSINWLAMDPAGRYVAVSYAHRSGGEFLLWDLEREQVVLERPETAGGWRVDFDKSGQTLAFGQGARGVEIIRLPDCQVVAQFDANLPRIFSLALHPDGQRLAVFDEAGNAELHDAMSKELLTAAAVGCTWPVPRWSPNGGLLAVGSKYNLVHLLDANSLEEIRKLRGQRSVVNALSFHPSGQFLAGSAWGGYLLVWDVATGKTRLRTDGFSPQFDITGRRFATLERFEPSSPVHIWEFAPAVECRHLHGLAWEPEEEHAMYAACSRDERLCFLGGLDGASLWDLATGRYLATLPHGLTRQEGVTGAAFDPADGSLLIATLKGLFRWPVRRDDDGGVQVGPPVMVSDGRETFSVAVSSDGNLLAYDLGRKRGITLLDRRHGETRCRLLPNPDKAVLQYVAVSAGGRWIASSAYLTEDAKSKVYVWNGRSLGLAHQLELEPPPPFLRMAFSPNERLLAVLIPGKTVILETETWEEVASLPDLGKQGLFSSDRQLHGVFSPDGQLFAANTANGAVKLFSTKTWEELAELAPTPAPPMVHKLAFTPDGSRLVAPHASDGARVWDLGRVRRRLRDFGLDWGDPLPPVVALNRTPLRVKVEPGFLARPAYQARVEQALKNGKYYSAMTQAEQAVRANRQDLYSWRVLIDACRAASRADVLIRAVDRYLQSDAIPPGPCVFVLRDFFRRPQLGEAELRAVLRWAEVDRSKFVPDPALDIVYRYFGEACYRDCRFADAIAFLDAAEWLRLTRWQGLSPEGNLVKAMAHLMVSRTADSPRHRTLARQYYDRAVAAIEQSPVPLSPDAHAIRAEATRLFSTDRSRKSDPGTPRSGNAPNGG